MRSRRSFVPVVVAAGVFLTTACGGSTAEEAASVPAEVAFDVSLPTEPLERAAVIGMSVQNLERTFFVALDAGARGEAANRGARLLVADAGDDATTQVQDVRELIEAGVDGIVLSPVDSGAASEIATIAADAGVPLLAVANQIGTVEENGPQFVFPGTVALVTNDDIDMGRKAADIAASVIGDDSASIAIVEGKTGTANAVMRRDGFTSGLDELGTDYTIVDAAAGDWTSDGGREACASFAASNELTMVFSMSDAMTEGCVEALAEADRDDVAVVSIGGNAAGVGLLGEGDIVGTVCQKPGTMGALAVEVMIDALESAEFEQGLRFYETPVVTAENQTAVCNPQW